MPAADWLSYRLESLRFQNGAVLNFANAQMLYADDDDELLITRLGVPPGVVDQEYAKTIGPGAVRSPVVEIRYEMRADGFRKENFFYHPLQAGAGVFLFPRPAGENVLILRQTQGRTIFSKEWTLRQVTAGRIPIDKAVWQFHGYKHEH